jgi:hypothetical protein
VLLDGLWLVQSFNIIVIVIRECYFAICCVLLSYHCIFVPFAFTLLWKLLDTCDKAHAYWTTQW